MRQPLLYRPRPRTRTLKTSCVCGMLVLLLAAAGLRADAQTPAAQPVPDTSASHASVPSGALPPVAPAPAAPPVSSAQPIISAKQLREADQAYLAGARQMQRKDLAGADQDFAHAVELNPNNRDYALAFLVAREHRIIELVGQAAAARRDGDIAKADDLLSQARRLDPDNRVIAQHFPEHTAGAEAITTRPYENPSTIAGDALAPTLAGTITLKPNPGNQSLRLNADTMSEIRTVYQAFGITPVFDSSVTPGRPLEINLENTSFQEATRVVNGFAHVFAVPLQDKQVLIVRDTQDLRDQYQQQVEETIYTPGASADQMTEMATIARNLFDLKQVTASATGGTLLLRGDPNVLQQLNAVYADMLDGGTDVLFDIKLYEFARTNTRNLGTTLPTSIGVNSITGIAQQIVSSNQTILQQVLASGQLKTLLNGNYFHDIVIEALALVELGGVAAPEFTNLIGVLGSLGGVPLAGVFLGSTTTFNAMLGSSDTRILDAVQLRSSSGQPTNFRAGSRYPIITASYSSGASSALTSQLAGLKINGTSVSSLLSQYLGTSSTVPQFQFEDLGITLKLTPRIQNSNEVQLNFDMKVESLAGGSINNVPVLNNRAITSTLSIPAGQTAMIATLVSRSELKSISGVPGLSELPGFAAGGDESTEKDSDELLVTITPHIVRQGRIRIASRALAAVKTTSQPSVQ